MKNKKLSRYTALDIAKTFTVSPILVAHGNARKAIEINSDFAEALYQNTHLKNIQ